MDPDRFRRITRRGEFGTVMDGIRAAQAAGIRIKLNAVALKGLNEDELSEMVRWAHGQDMDLTLIETMPMGEIDEDRTDRYLPLSLVRERLAQDFTLKDLPERTAARHATSRWPRPAASSASSRR